MAMISGLEVTVSSHLPRPLIGHRVRPLRAHKWIAWLLRRLIGTDHVLWLREPMYGTPDALRVGNKLIVPPEMFEKIHELPRFPHTEGQQ
jgi:hypothetical protein